MGLVLHNMRAAEFSQCVTESLSSGLRSRSRGLSSGHTWDCIHWTTAIIKSWGSECAFAGSLPGVLAKLVFTLARVDCQTIRRCMLAMRRGRLNFLEGRELGESLVFKSEKVRKALKFTTFRVFQTLRSLVCDAALTYSRRD